MVRYADLACALLGKMDNPTLNPDPMDGTRYVEIMRSHVAPDYVLHVVITCNYVKELAQPCSVILLILRIYMYGLLLLDSLACEASDSHDFNVST